MFPLHSSQNVHSNQRCGQEQPRAVCVAEKEQEAQGNDVVERGQLCQPLPKDGEETQKNCNQEVSEDQEAAAAEADGAAGSSKRGQEENTGGQFA